MAGLMLIKNQDDWTAYMTSVSVAHNIPQSLIAWGKGPASFPCLAASMYIGDKLRSCYVYLDDAIGLVEAAGMQAVKPGESVTAPGSTLPSEWMRYMNANVRAIVHELLSVSITNQERYEKVLAHFLADADQEHEEKKWDILNKLTGPDHE